MNCSGLPWKLSLSTVASTDNASSLQITDTMAVSGRKKRSSGMISYGPVIFIPANRTWADKEVPTNLEYLSEANPLDRWLASPLRVDPFNIIGYIPDRQYRMESGGKQETDRLSTQGQAEDVEGKYCAGCDRVNRANH